jgi:hypothetical protein
MGDMEQVALFRRTISVQLGSNVSFTNKMDLELRKKLVKCYIWSIALYGDETWTLQAIDHKNLETFEMWRWRRMDNISSTDHGRNEEVLLRAKEQSNILHEMRKLNVTWIGHILRRNCLLRRKDKRRDRSDR